MNALRLWSAASLSVVGFVVSATGERSALAEAVHPPVVIEVEECEQPLEAELRRIVGVELRMTVVDAVDPRGAVTRVVVTCRGSGADLLLKETATAKDLERTVALSEAAPTARARLLALAVAELVVASWQEIQSSPESTGPARPPGQPPPSVTRAPEGASAEQHKASAMAEAMGVARVFPGSGLWLLGAGARGFLTPSRPFTLTLDLTAEWGKASRTTGQVAARTIGGGLGLGWGVERKWAFIMPWVGARAGVARLAGESNSTTTSGATQSGLWLGPEVGVAATLFPHAAVHATMALSAGVLLLGVRGEVFGDRNVNVLGPWVALVVGVGITKSRGGRQP